ncbi:hypothetical protein MVEN_01048900 [Mycena venus]|uniref:Uncharacterized protein n=1 Tax=Mycena venus TaxID=2733690 RepID=A0A8H6Y6N7_9AGAR|nr:hypothetical protein MVEN_01048900 [Mycena venus]
MIITSDSKDVKQAPEDVQQTPKDVAGSSSQFKMPSLRPMIFGYETRVEPTGEQKPHICPRCKNASVFSSTNKEQIVVMFVAVSSNATASWLCTTEKCGWSAPLDRDPMSWEPAPAYSPSSEPPKLVDA